MNIYLVRHAISESLSGSKAKVDAQRELTSEGFVQAKMMSQALIKMNVKLTMVLSSPYKRAVQTAETFATENSITVTTSNKLAPGVNIDSLCREVEKLQEESELMIVGHEPDMGDIASKLLGGDKMFSLPFKKASILCVMDIDAPTVLPGKLGWLITPDVVTSLQA